MSKVNRSECCLSIVTILVLLLFSCGRSPLSETSEKSGALNVQAFFYESGQARLQKEFSTNVDSLIVEINSASFLTIHYSIPVNSSTVFLNDTLENIPADENCLVSVWSVNRNGVILHRDSVAQHNVKISTSMMAQVFSKLIPVAGSIYLHVGNIPSSVDTVFAIFTETISGKIWQSKAARSSKVYMAIDNVPDHTTGVLRILGVGPANDTLYKSSKTITYSVNDSSMIALEFYERPGNLGVNIDLVQPNALLVNANMGQYSGDSVETGEVFITEIMYASNDSEYVELYNPGSELKEFDTLRIDIDGVVKRIANVIINPNGYFTIGRRSLPWCNAYMSPVSFLDLSIAGNWITIRSVNGQMIDRVSFTGANNTIEWPNITGKRSVILSSSNYSANGNNYGRNWFSATNLINGSATQYGTPGGY